MTTDMGFAQDFGLTGKKEPRKPIPGFQVWDGNLITVPGAYRSVPMDRYHGAEICAGPSTSSTGMKTLAGEKASRTKGQTPRHFWEQSNLNPNRKRREDTDALRLGRMFHDALLEPAIYDTAYYVLPEGFTRAAKVKMAAEIAEADAAIAAGLTVCTIKECERINSMVDAVRADELIAPYLAEGEAEVTLAWQDKETGVWLRARPDWMLPDRSIGMNFKTDADASFSGFSKSIGKFSYAQSAALEMDGYEAVFGRAPRKYFHPVVEKPGEGWEPGDYIATALWELPEDDITRGRWLNRIAIRRFADCLASGKWPGYTEEPERCGMPRYARRMIDFGGASEDMNDDIQVGE